MGSHRVCQCSPPLEEYFPGGREREDTLWRNNGRNTKMKQLLDQLSAHRWNLLSQPRLMAILALSCDNNVFMLLWLSVTLLKDREHHLRASCYCSPMMDTDSCQHPCFFIQMIGLLVYLGEAAGELHHSVYYLCCEWLSSYYHEHRHLPPAQQSFQNKPVSDSWTAALWHIVTISQHTRGEKTITW